MTRSGSPSHLHRLIDAAIGGRLNAAEARELEERLRTDDEAVRLFLEYCQLETELRFTTRARLAGRRAISELCQVESEPTASRVPATPTDTRRVAGRWSCQLLEVPARSGWWGSMAAMLCVAVGLWWLAWNWSDLPAERQPQPIARLTDSHGAEWLGDAWPNLGHSFVEGDSVYLTKGQAQISMSSGAEVMLRGPCFVTLAAAHRVELEEGVLTAQVAEWGHGFTVSTQALQVVDLGTRFAVAASASGMSEAHVLDGQVRVQPVSAAAANRRSLLLSSGEALRVGAKEQIATRLKANPELYDAEIGDVPPFKPMNVFNTGRRLVPGDEDPHWRITAGPKGDFFHGPQFAVVCEADYRYLANEPEKSQWISLANPVRPGAPPNSIYTFATEFDVTGFDLSTVTLAAQVIADNGVQAVRINGKPAPITAWMLNEPQQKFNRFVAIEFNTGLVPGVNTVEFDVRNGIDFYDREGPNPISLRVEWQAFGRLLRPTGRAMRNGTGSHNRTAALDNTAPEHAAGPVTRSRRDIAQRLHGGTGRPWHPRLVDRQKEKSHVELDVDAA